MKYKLVQEELAGFKMRSTLQNKKLIYIVIFIENDFDIILNLFVVKWVSGSETR